MHVDNVLKHYHTHLHIYILRIFMITLQVRDSISKKNRLRGVFSVTITHVFDGNRTNELEVHSHIKWMNRTNA